LKVACEWAFSCDSGRRLNELHLAVEQRLGDRPFASMRRSTAADCAFKSSSCGGSDQISVHQSKFPKSMPSSPVHSARRN